MKKLILRRPGLIIGAVGLATFFFGFGAGALYNWYLIQVDSPLLHNLRGSLDFKSAIFGDGILLPLLNMYVMWFLLKNKKFVKRHLVRLSLVIGGVITILFHIHQAVLGLVNWSMPEPWHWNYLGVWHACYMFVVASFLSLFYLVFLRKAAIERRFAKGAIIVTIGIIMFFLILHTDYKTVTIRDLLFSLKY